MLHAPVSRRSSFVSMASRMSPVYLTFILSFSPPYGCKGVCGGFSRADVLVCRVLNEKHRKCISWPSLG